MMITLYCRCGAGSEGFVSSPLAEEKFRALWSQEHSGDGHGDCERKVAVAAYRKKEAGSRQNMGTRDDG